MDMELPARVLTLAQRRDPAPAQLSRLVLFRESLITYRAKGISYEQISAEFRLHGIIIAASTIGYYCRRYCLADIERMKRHLSAGVAGQPAPKPNAPLASTTLPSSGTARKRGPHIARDDF